MMCLPKLGFLSKPADMVFLVRLCLYGLVTGVCAFIARLTTEAIITTGVGFEANPFTVFPTVETSGLIIAVGVGVAFSMLFLWGQMQPHLKSFHSQQFESWPETSEPACMDARLFGLSRCSRVLVFGFVRLIMIPGTEDHARPSNLKQINQC